MSVKKRPFADVRNTYFVDNNDPKAFDKSHRGQPGTHTEQRCCGDRAPYLDTLFYRVGESGHVYMTAPYTELWCHECTTYLEEQWEENFIPTFNVTKEYIRIVAMAISYVPVFGTGVGFLLSTSVNLADGQNIEKAALDAIGSSIPGQPLSGAVFNAVRSIANGDRIDTLLIASLPIDQGSKDAITSCVDIAKKIADGQPLTKIGMQEIYNRLPPNGQKAMVISQKLIDGEPVADVAIEAVGAEAKEALRNTAEMARNMGVEAARQFVVQSGFSGALDSLPRELQTAIKSGIVVGDVERRVGINSRIDTFTTEETAKNENDVLAQKGQMIINGGAIYSPPGYNIPLINIRAGKGAIPITYTRRFDAVSGTWQNGNYVENYLIDSPEARRGFDVAIGASEGATTDGPGQQRIRASLTLGLAQRGFDLGQQIQLSRTKTATFSKGIDAMSYASAIGRNLSAADQRSIAEWAAKGQAIAAGSAQVAAAQSLGDTSPNPGGWRWGFNIATGLIQGMSVPGPGQTAWRLKLGPFSPGSGPNSSMGSNEAMQGYDVGQALQHGISKAIAKRDLDIAASAPPNVGAGMLIANGLAGSGADPDIKAGVIQSTLANSGAKAGATAVIQKKTGFFHSIAVFFGLAD